jgi:hypothetical protein
MKCAGSLATGEPRASRVHLNWVVTEQMKSAPIPIKRIDKTPAALTNSPSSIRALQTVTAAIEMGAGLALLSFPSATAILLVGAPLKAPAALVVARVAGTALLTLGLACWLAREDTNSPSAKGLVAAMLFYNLGVALILCSARIQLHLIGIALWPAVVLHASMTIWCIISLLSAKREGENPVPQQNVSSRTFVPVDKSRD